MNACRHGWFPGSILAVAIVLLGLAPVDAMHLKENPKRHRILYQLDEAGVDKAKFVLGNIRNHVTGVGGWQNIESLELVVFGPALKSFVQLDRSCAQAGAGTAPESGHELRRLREHDEEFQHHARATTTRLAGTASGRGRANHGAPGARIQLPPALTLPASLEVPATGG